MMSTWVSMSNPKSSHISAWASDRLFSMRQTIIFSKWHILLPACVSIPQTEKMHFTNACDTGADKRLRARSVIRWRLCCDHQDSGYFWTTDKTYADDGIGCGNFLKNNSDFTICNLSSCSFYIVLPKSLLFSFQNLFSISFKFSKTEINHYTFSFSFSC